MKERSKKNKANCWSRTRTDRSGRPVGSPVGRTGRQQSRISLEAEAVGTSRARITKTGPVGPTGLTVPTGLDCSSHFCMWFPTVLSGKADRSGARPVGRFGIISRLRSERSRRPVPVANRSSVTFLERPNRSGRPVGQGFDSRYCWYLMGLFEAGFTSLPLRWLEYKRQCYNPD